MLINKIYKSLFFEIRCKDKVLFRISDSFLVKKCFNSLIIVFWLHFMRINETFDKLNKGKNIYLCSKIQYH